MNQLVTQIKKRDGRIVPFDKARIATAIFKAAQSVGGSDRLTADLLANVVTNILNEKYDGHTIPTVEEVQDIVEKVLIEEGHAKTAKAYILYRDQHSQIRDLKSFVNSDEILEGYLKQTDWLVKENSNMTFSLQGLNNHVASAVSKHYWLHKIYPKEIREAHSKADFHIHDLQILAAYCCGWDLKDLLIRGFGGVKGKIESKPAKHLKSALGQIVNFFYTLQGETAGAQAFSNFDTYLAPFVKHDNLNYEQVKQHLQEFMFNMNVPTRVGFQCVSEDTEILTLDGWQNYQTIKTSDIIKTFNLKTGKIENQKTTSIFKKHYQGIMYRLKNRIQDQLISPQHRVVRKKFQTNNYVLEPIEKICSLKSPVIIPIAGQNTKKEANISDEQIKLMAWIISEGTIERPIKYRCCYRVSIYQSKEKNRQNYNEIVNLLKHFKLNYSENETASLGDQVKQLRLNAESSKKIHHWFGTKENIHFIPDHLLNLSQRQSNLFLETYLKADGFEGCKISTADLELLDSLQIIIVNAGYGFTVLKRKPTIGKKDIYVLRIVKHQDTYIAKIKKVNYKGIIWCPQTQNETIIARRKGKVFITGNTPFTNITMDLNPPANMANESIILGGLPQKEKYGDFQREMDIINKAFAEVAMAGDARGRVFTFPIPTYNITKNFDWHNETRETIWEMTAKYGLPYFSNFINSDMKPEDARSMCCRLRLDNRELRQRGGGLFGANPLTGAIGVVTINLPRLGFLSKSEQEFFVKLKHLMDLAKQSLEIKREIMEKFTTAGLYPYAKYYLDQIKEHFDEYWKNHFSTIGLNGMNEACLNLINEPIDAPAGQELAKKVLDFMRETIMDYQNQTGNIYNLEATPAEGTTYRFAKTDKELYPTIICANEQAWQNKKAAPYYTNSSHLPVNRTADIFTALDLQDELQIKYTGGTVLHGFIGEKLPSGQVVKILVRKIAENYKLPYFTLTPTFSICPNHNYIAGEYFKCPHCKEECEVYSRVVGYLRPVQQWNDGKQAEFYDRKEYQIKIAV